MSQDSGTLEAGQNVSNVAQSAINLCHLHATYMFMRYNFAFLFLNGHELLSILR